MHFDIREYAESKLDKAKDVASSKGGQEMAATCPWCDRWGGFYINVDSGAYVCFKCDARGKSVVGLVATLEDLTPSEARSFIFKNSVTLRRKETVFTLADRVRGIRPHAVEEGDDEPDRVAVDLPSNFRPVYKGGKWSLPAYLKERRIKSATARAWGLGFCRGGRYGGRLIIPIVCPNGESFTARDMTGEQQPKYLNPPDADHRRLLIGWNVARLTGDFAIVEGPLDAVKLFQHDVSALALGGKTVHDEQLSMLMSLPADSAVTVMLDPEEAVAPFDVAERLSAHFANIYIAKLPEGVDPGGSSRTVAHRALDDATRWTGDRNARLRGRIAGAAHWMRGRYGGRKKSH